MSRTQLEKGVQFLQMHKSNGAFVIANPWDAGSARLLAAMGFEALATSSGASAGVLGRRDGNITRDESLAMAGSIASAVDVPVSADLERGFGDSPEDTAKAILMAAELGLVGASIEDATGKKDDPIYELGMATERVAAAAHAAHSLPFPFTFTARCENYLRNRPDLDDTLRRLQAYDKAGADVLFAPGVPDLATLRIICSEVSKPVNFMVGIPGKSFTLAELEAAGVKRVSLATSLYRSAMKGLFEAAREVREKGTFQFVSEGLP